MLLQIKTLQEGRELARSHPCKSLNPVMQGGLIRVGGRLKHALFNEDEQNPIILPIKSAWSTLLIRHYHDYPIMVAPS